MLFNVQQPLVLLTLFKRCSEFRQGQPADESRLCSHTDSQLLGVTFTQTQTHDQKGVGCELNGGTTRPSPAS